MAWWHVQCIGADMYIYIYIYMGVVLYSFARDWVPEPHLRGLARTVTQKLDFVDLGL